MKTSDFNKLMKTFGFGNARYRNSTALTGLSKGKCIRTASGLLKAIWVADVSPTTVTDPQYRNFQTLLSKFSKEGFHVERVGDVCANVTGNGMDFIIKMSAYPSYEGNGYDSGYLTYWAQIIRKK